MQIRFDLPEKLYNSINKYCEDGKRAEFIRQALEEKISRKKKELKEFNGLMDKIEKLDPLDVQNNLSDLLLTATILFSETKKQNELLKINFERIAEIRELLNVSLEEEYEASELLKISKEVKVTSNQIFKKLEI